MLPGVFFNLSTMPSVMKEQLAFSALPENELVLHVHCTVLHKAKFINDTHIYFLLLAKEHCTPLNGCEYNILRLIT